MDNWIELPFQQLITAQTQKIRGMDVVVYVSPHNLPRAVRGRLSEKKDIFVIDFKYLDEPEAQLQLSKPSKDGVVTLFTGRSNGRIERIHVNIKAIAAENVSLNINVVEEAEKGLQELKDEESILSRILNIDAARNAIELSRNAFCLA